MHHTVVIPSRYSSTRLPGKPLLDIMGKPMVVRVAEQADLILTVLISVIFSAICLVSAISSAAAEERRETAPDVVRI